MQQNSIKNKRIIFLSVIFFGIISYVYYKASKIDLTDKNRDYNQIKIDTLIINDSTNIILTPQNKKEFN